MGPFHLGHRVLLGILLTILPVLVIGGLKAGFDCQRINQQALRVAQGLITQASLLVLSLPTGKTADLAAEVQRLKVPSQAGLLLLDGEGRVLAQAGRTTQQAGQILQDPLRTWWLKALQGKPREGWGRGDHWTLLAPSGHYDLMLAIQVEMGPELALWRWNVLYWLLAMSGVGVVTALLAILRQRRQSRQVEKIIEQQRRLALSEPIEPLTSPRLGDPLSRLELAIGVMQTALVERMSLYRRFFDAAPDMFLTVMAASGAIIDANPAFCRMVGLLKSEVLGQPLEHFLSLDKDWQEVLHRPGQLLTGVLRTDQGDRKIEASVSLERGMRGQRWLLGMMIRDLSVRQALHEQLLAKSTALEKALEEIRSVEQLKDQFLTTLSHELKTPLVSLKGFLQLMMRGQMQTDQADEYIQICWRNLNKLEKQINNLLDLARLSHAKDQFEMGTLDLASLIRTEVDNLKGVAAEHEVTMDLTGVPNRPVPVWGNMEKMIQLLDNLLMNAVKYNIRKGKVRVNLARSDGKLVLSISDSGMGMAREQMAKIFNYFYRADMKATGRLEGLGIGLSLVQEIVRLHKGDIKVQSEPGKGTTFTVILDAA